MTLQQKHKTAKKVTKYFLFFSNTPSGNVWMEIWFLNLTLKMCRAHTFYRSLTLKQCIGHAEHTIYT